MLELKQSVLSLWGMQVREINCFKTANYEQNPSLRRVHCKTPQNKVATGKLPITGHRLMIPMVPFWPCTLVFSSAGVCELQTFFIIQSLIC